MSWKSFVWGIFVGAVITLAITGYYAWISIGAIPLIGSAIQYKIKQKVKIVPTKDFSRGRGDRRREG